MSEARTPDAPPAAADAAADPAAAIAALRARGAHRVDPVRFHYLEALARRVAAHTGPARQVLDRRLAHALSACAQACESAQAAAVPGLAALAQRFAQAADEIHRLQAAGDLRALRRLAARLEARGPRGTLAELARRLEHPASAPQASHAPHAADALAGSDAAPAELNALRRYRRTWTRLAIDQQLSRSRAQLPETPGPLNSHFLVLRALRRMQDIAPAYLHRFMAHADALLWLEQAGDSDAPAPTGPAARDGERRRRPARGRGG